MGDTKEQDALPPPYTYSYSPPSPSASSITPSTPLHAQISQTRSTRITNLVSTYVPPLLSSLATSGLSSTTLIVLPSPSNPTLSTSSLTVSDLIGLPSNAIGTTTLVRLEGQENSEHFWTQPSVLSELEGLVKARVAAEGYTIIDPHSSGSLSPREREALSPPPPQQSTTAVQEKKATGGWFRRKTTEVKKEAAGGDLPEAMRETTVKKGMEKHEARVNVEAREVSCRVVTEMGLYDTVSAKAIMVSVVVGG